MSKTLPLVSLQLVKPLLRALTLRGVNPNSVLDSVGLTMNAVETKDTNVHVMVMHQFVENCAAAVGDVTFCTEIGAEIQESGWPMLQRAFEQAGTLGEFLNNYVLQATKVASSSTAFLEVRGTNCIFGETRRFKPLIEPAQNDGFMAGLTLTMLERMLGDRLDPSRVILVLCDPSVLPKRFKRYQALRGDRMGVRLQFPTEWLNISNTERQSDVGAWSAADDRDEGSFLVSFRNLIRQNIGFGEFGSEQAAALVHMKPRTLARHLKEFDTTISRELNHARREFARTALKGGNRTVEDIASALGYSDPSNFSRAFARDENMTPSEFRAASPDSAR